MENARPSFKQDVVGAYEDRIRKYSSPEKLFEMFASIHKGKDSFMTPSDLLRAITPYKKLPSEEVGTNNFKYNWQAKNMGPSKEQIDTYHSVMKSTLPAKPSLTPKQPTSALLQARKDLNISSQAHLEVLQQCGWSNAEYEEFVERNGGPKRNKFFSMVDVDGDGLISYEEFMLFNALMAIPSNKVGIAFSMYDTDGSGYIERDELEKVLKALRKSTAAGAQEVDNTILGGLKRSNTHEFTKLFGVDETGRVTKAAFETFVNDLQLEAMRAKFHQYDADGNGVLDAEEFSRFLIGLSNEAKSLEERIRGPHFAKLNVRISEHQFLQFYKLLRHLDELKVAMALLGGHIGVRKSDFHLAARAAGNVSIPDDIVEVLFALFDVNQDGFLSDKEFIQVMQHSMSHGAAQARDMGVGRFLLNLIRCIKLEAL